jgi:hypothetical protein
VTPLQRVHAVWFAVTVSVALVATGAVVRANAARDRAILNAELASEEAARLHRHVASAARHIKQLRAKCGLD